MGEAYIGDAYTGDAYIGDAYMGDAYIGDAYIGDAYIGDATSGLAQRRRRVGAAAGAAAQPCAKSTWFGCATIAVVAQLLERAASGVDVLGSHRGRTA